MTVRILHGDCRTVLSTLPADSVQCCVTSPPYYGLRDYGTASWEGGDPLCDHRKPADGTDPTKGSTLGGGKKTTGHQQEGWRGTCRKCGARRVDSQIGLEPTPDEYVAEMVAVFREVRRVLRDDGTLWLNVGDSYAAGGMGPGSGKQLTNAGANIPAKKAPPGYKPKDLLGIPWMLAFALRADGWYLRSDIIWHKPNPMPESVRDRPTSAHEHVFLLTKAGRYFYDAVAIMEDCESGPSDIKKMKEQLPRIGGKHKALNDPMSAASAATNIGKKRGVGSPDGRNARNVWTATQPYSGAHFATMPPDLAERCIKAGTKPGDTVLDPFGGAGTTGLVADRLKRNAVLIELNPKYRTLAEDRLRDDAPLFVDIE